MELKKVEKNQGDCNKYRRQIKRVNLCIIGVFKGLKNEVKNKRIMF